VVTIVMVGAVFGRPGGNDRVGFGVERQHAFAALVVVKKEEGGLVV